ncbi:MAG: calcium/sodium antiporter [Lachnospiraceae bacterium]|nr:calcium/sodium antiporter [Lachnospiraceae bacterium]
MIQAVLLFIAGLAALIKGGDWFVDGASGIAKRLHVPEIIIGATVVSIGTTLPEVMVSASAAVTGHGEIAYGNALGSIICNTALISALTMAIRPSNVERKSFLTPVLFFFGAIAFYAVNAYAFGEFSRLSGIILLVIFCAYVAVILWQEKKKRAALPGGGTAIVPETEDQNGAAGSEAEVKGAEKEMPLWKEILFLVLGAALIAVGARLLVDNGTILATILGVPESVIALTFVALGTSLPELVTAVTSLIKGHSALSLGNIIGANLFNLVLVAGLSTTLSPYKVPAGKTIFGVNASLALDIPLCFLVMALLALPALKKEKVMRWQGIVLLVIYAAYIAFQFFF